MRLWHIDLIPYLPKSQLLAQWRELNSIFKKQDKHILINYVYNYDKTYLTNYTYKVLEEMKKTKIKLQSYKNLLLYLGKCFIYPNDPILSLRFAEHNNEYLTICYYNLKEKYIRGQKDFTDDVWDKLDEFYKKEIANDSN